MRLFITSPLPFPEVRALLTRSDLTVEQWSGLGAIPDLELKRALAKADLLLCLLTDKITNNTLIAAPKLKLISNYAVGFDNIDLLSANQRGVMVANAPAREVSDSVAEHTAALILAVAHRLVESDHFVRAGKYEGWRPNLLIGTLIKGKVLGIVGGGKIGESLGEKMARGFGMKVIYADQKQNLTLEASIGAVMTSLPALLSESDVVSLHVPLTPTTRHLIGERELALMKPTAILINTARGQVVHEHALIAALERGIIGGAGLDVYECEPALACVPDEVKRLSELTNVVLTPHTASATLEARRGMAREAVSNIVAFLEGKEPPHLVRL